MNWNKRGINAYKREKGQGSGHDLDFDGEKDIPIVSLTTGKLAQQKKQKKKPVTGKQPAGEAPAEGGRLDFQDQKRQEELTESLIKASTEAEGYRKAAKLLLLLGTDQAVRVLKHLEPEEIEAISGEIAAIRKVDRIEAEHLLKEFGMIMKKPIPRQGGIGAARDILHIAFGDEKGEEFLKRVMPHGKGKPFEFLNDLEFHQIVQLMKHEPVSVMSVILPQLDRGLASKVIEVLPVNDQKEVISRMARLRKIDKDVLVRMEEALKMKIRKQGKIVTEEIDGTSVLADILKHMTISDEYNIIENLHDENPDLAKDIKEKLFSTDTVLQLYDQDLQRVLRDFDDHELAVLLKGKDSDFREKIFTNLSERRRMLIEEEMDFLGALKKSDVEKSTREFLRYLQAMADEGKVVLRRENDYFVE